MDGYINAVLYFVLHSISIELDLYECSIHKYTLVPHVAFSVTPVGAVGPIKAV